MNHSKKYMLTRILAIQVMAVYVFIMVSYLFFTPLFQNRRAINNAGVKTNTQLIYNLLRTNRCMMNDKKPVKQIVKLQIRTFTGVKPWPKALALATVQHNSALCLLIDHHFAYLSNRVLRI